MPTIIQNAKIACLDFDLSKSKIQMGVQVVVTDPLKLEQIRERELNITKERIQKILSIGANVVLTTKGIDDMASKYFVEAKAIACKRVTREDLCRIAKATGAEIVLALADIEGNETFETSMLGYAGIVYEERVNDDNMLIFKDCRHHSVTMFLRGSNDYILDEIDRSIHDGLCVVKKILDCGTVVPGGGAVEISLSVFLENLVNSLVSKEQHAFAEFADAILIIPKTLLVHASKDAIELAAKLRTFHYACQLNNCTIRNSDFAQFGFDLIHGTIRKNLDAGVLEPTISKTKILQFATEAAITILRIDDFIRITESDEIGRSDQSTT
jgi:T-complex protein 1 subunit alpha